MGSLNQQESFSSIPQEKEEDPWTQSAFAPCCLFPADQGSCPVLSVMGGQAAQPRAARQAEPCSQSSAHLGQVTTTLGKGSAFL